MLEKYRVDLASSLENLKSSILESAGVEFNVDSPRQLGEVLFDTLKISAKAKKTKTGQYQTGEDVLKKLVENHPIVSLVLEYRKLKKLLSTYVELFLSLFILTQNACTLHICRLLPQLVG